MPAIAGVNFLLGWTVIGWIGAFIWALTPITGAAPATSSGAWQSIL